MYRFKGWQNNKSHAFPSKRCISNEKLIIHFTMKIIRTYLYITCNKKILFAKKNILAYCGYSPTSPFFLLLSEHKHWDNTTTNSNSENARSRMVASTGCVWAAGFHRVTARSRLARVLKLMNSLFSNFFFRAAVNHGYGGPPVCLKLFEV